MINLRPHVMRARSALKVSKIAHLDVSKVNMVLCTGTAESIVMKEIGAFPSTLAMNL